MKLIHLHYENMPIQIYRKCYLQKQKIFRQKKQQKKTHTKKKKHSDIFHISSENIDFGYSLEPPRRGDSNYPQSMFSSKIK